MIFGPFMHVIRDFGPRHEPVDPALVDKLFQAPILFCGPFSPIENLVVFHLVSMEAEKGITAISETGSNFIPVFAWSQ